MTPPSKLLVRPAVQADAGALAAFQQAMALETEGKRLDPEILAAGVDAVLADPHKGRYLVAERDGEVLGSLAVTLEWSDWRAAWFWWIQSVFVAESARRQGLYRALYNGVVAEAKAAGDVRGIRLYVERDNQGARSTYEALGMQESAYRMYEVDFFLGPGA